MHVSNLLHIFQELTHNLKCFLYTLSAARQDYVHKETELTFLDRSIECENVTIIDDNIVEYNFGRRRERFFVELYSTDTYINIAGITRTEISIRDDDSK